MRAIILFFLLAKLACAAWTTSILRVDKGAGKIAVVYSLTDSVSGEVIVESVFVNTLGDLKASISGRIAQITAAYNLADTLPLGAFSPTIIPPIVAATGTYNALASQVTAGASKDYLNVFNAVGSGKVLRVVSILISPANTAAVVGSAANFTVSKTSTVGATCTAITIRALDSTAPAVPAQVTASTTCTTDPAVSFDLFPCAVTPEETIPSGQVYCYHQDAGEDLLTLREGEGLTVKTTALAPVGLVSVVARFVM